MFNLINILGQNTLPEQVEVNKQNIAILADEVEKLGYQPKGVYSAETEYNHNDVVFYDNKLYVVTSDAAIVGVLPTNTTYWQQVTGDIRGPQGAQGEQGEAGAAGAAGADGLNALEFAYLLSLTTIGDVGSLSLQVSEANFNRQTIQYEHFNCYAKDSNNKVYLFDAQVTNPGQHGVPASQAQISLNLATKFLISGEDGADGATGQAALVYGRKINFTWNGETEQLLSGLSLSFQDFNRVPELNEDFVVILHDTLYAVDYLAMGEVQTKSNLNVTSIVATDINRITGQNGQNGTNGTDGTNGQDALVYGVIRTNDTYPTVGTQITLSVANFNRTPSGAGEKFILIGQQNGTNRSYIAICSVVDWGAVNLYATPQQIVETTGAQGAGSTLYMHNIKMQDSNDSRRKFFVNVNLIRPYSGQFIDYTLANSLYNWGYAGGYNNNHTYLLAQGYVETDIGSGTYYRVIGIGANANGTRYIGYDTGSGSISYYSPSDFHVIVDNVAALS